MKLIKDRSNLALGFTLAPLITLLPRELYHYFFGYNLTQLVLLFIIVISPTIGLFFGITSRKANPQSKKALISIIIISLAIILGISLLILDNMTRQVFYD